ncbi:MAG: hypothetical protein P8R04_04005, partial [Gammaproteobacteria bacterium]|nr:hypothetical protein [Gammaproteobacteria bacterium]
MKNTVILSALLLFAANTAAVAEPVDYTFQVTGIERTLVERNCENDLNGQLQCVTPTEIELSDSAYTPPDISVSLTYDASAPLFMGDLSRTTFSSCPEGVSPCYDPALAQYISFFGPPNTPEDDAVTKLEVSVTHRGYFNDISYTLSSDILQVLFEDETSALRTSLSQQNSTVPENQAQDMLTIIAWCPSGGSIFGRESNCSDQTLVVDGKFFYLYQIRLHFLRGNDGVDFFPDSALSDPTDCDEGDFQCQFGLKQSSAMLPEALPPAGSAETAFVLTFRSLETLEFENTTVSKYSYSFRGTLSPLAVQIDISPLNSANEVKPTSNDPIVVA